MSNTKFNSFNEFYPFYLSEHAKKTTKIFHAAGSLIVLAILIYCIITKDWEKLYLTPIFGYGFAWFSHLVFEKNKPATFKYPLYSLMGDFRMFFEILRGKQRIF